MGRELSRKRFQAEEIGWLSREGSEASEDVGLSRNFTHTDLLRGLRGISLRRPAVYVRGFLC